MLNNFPVMTSDRFNGIEKRVKKSLSVLCKLVGSEKVCEESKTFKKALKRFKKAQYMKENHRTFFNDFKTENLVNYFRNYREENGDSWKDLFVFNTTDKEAVIQQLEEMWVQIDGSSWSSDYDCTGRAFYRSCDFYELEDRIIVTQWGGLDV